MSRWESRNLHYNMLVRGHSRREKPDDAHELCNQRAASKKTAEGHPHMQPSAIAFPWALQAKNTSTQRAWRVARGSIYDRPQLRTGSLIDMQSWVKQGQSVSGPPIHDLIR